MYNIFFINKGPFGIKEICEKIQDKIECKVIGDNDLVISGISTLKDAKDNDITFLNNFKYLNQLEASKAGACIVDTNEDIGVLKSKASSSMTFIITDSPYYAYAKILDLFYEDRIFHFVKNNNQSSQNNNALLQYSNIDETAKIGGDCVIEPNVYIGPDARIGNCCKILSGAYIGANCVIGDNSYVGSSATLRHCVIGNNCIIHTGVRIGQDGFGFAHYNGNIAKIKQLGIVVIGDNVEIGANTCIDRGALNNTIIGNYTKIDNLVQIAHNVVIGAYCFIVAQTGIAGSTVIGDGVNIAGQVGIAGHLKIGNHVKIAAQSGVMHDLVDGITVGGYPAIEIRQWHRQTVMLKKMK